MFLQIMGWSLEAIMYYNGNKFYGFVKTLPCETFSLRSLLSNFKISFQQLDGLNLESFSYYILLDKIIVCLLTLL